MSQVKQKLEDLKTALLAEKLKEQIKVVKRTTGESNRGKKSKRYQEPDGNRYLQKQIDELRRDVHRLTNSVSQLINTQRGNNSPSWDTNYRTKQTNSPYKSPNKNNKTSHCSHPHTRQSLYIPPSAAPDYSIPFSLQDSRQVKRCLTWKIPIVKQTPATKQRKRKQSLWKKSYDQLYTTHENMYNSLPFARY